MKLTNEEKRVTIKNELYSLSKKSKSMEDFSYSSLKNKFNFDNTHKILENLVQQKVILQKYAQFHWFVPNDETGKNIVSTIEDKHGKHHWFDISQVSVIAWTLYTILLVLAILFFPEWIGNFNSMQQDNSSTVTFLLLVGGFFTMLLTIVLNKYLVFIRLFDGYGKHIFLSIVILILAVVLYKFVNIIASFLTILVLCFQVYNIFSRKRM